LNQFFLQITEPKPLPAIPLLPGIEVLQQLQTVGQFQRKRVCEAEPARQTKARIEQVRGDASKAATVPNQVPNPVQAAPVASPAPGIASPVKAAAATDKEAFLLDPRRMYVLKLFLQGKSYFNPAPTPFRKRQATEDILLYIQQRKAHYNSSAHVMPCPDFI
jgi:hypothetical protein